MATVLHKPITTIGRHPNCDIVIPANFDRVSREHAQIRREGQYFILYDTSSAGTTINGQPVRQKTLQEGDRISLAGQVEFVFGNGALHSSGAVASVPAPTRFDPSPGYAPGYSAPQPVVTSDKNRLTAGLLAILLGSLGVHKFYLNRPVEGIIYLLFSWTGIPAIIGLIEGIVLISMSDAEFAYKYGR